MTGQEYLENIKAELSAGRYQHRMGENVLRAFGYVRRRATAIEEINATLDSLGLTATPPITSDMPLKKPRIRFRLKPDDGTMTPEDTYAPETLGPPNGFESSLEEEAEESDASLPEPAFSVSELESAKTDVKCVSPSASIQKAYTTMVLHKFSQLVVADHPNPLRQDIKGIVSFRSMAKALMNGKPMTVGDCVDKDVYCAGSDTDLKTVVSQLSSDDVVLVIGRDNRLQGIVTAWDLAEEFADLVDPFKRIGEIEERLRTLVRKRLGKDKVADFLKDHGISGKDSIGEIEELTMGELQRVLDYPEHWNDLDLAFDRAVFIDALGKARDYRNRLMHFRDPLNEDEMAQLSNFCDAVREIQL